MAPAKHLPVSSSKKERIIDLKQGGKSTCDIARIVGRSDNVVKRIVANLKVYEQ